MNRILDGYCRVLEALLVLALAAMVVMVFGNVVLRYAFNSGITESEELSRWAFVWLTFLGAVVGIRERAHLGTDVLVGRLGPRGQRAALVVGQMLMIGVSVVFLKGSLEQTRINLTVSAPVTGWPVAVVYAAGMVFAASAVVLLAHDLWRAVTGRLSDAELQMVRESEELHGDEPAGTTRDAKEDAK